MSERQGPSSNLKKKTKAACFLPWALSPALPSLLRLPRNTFDPKSSHFIFAWIDFCFVFSRVKHVLYTTGTWYVQGICKFVEYLCEFVISGGKNGLLGANHAFFAKNRRKYVKQIAYWPKTPTSLPPLHDWPVCCSLCPPTGCRPSSKSRDPPRHPWRS